MTQKQDVLRRVPLFSRLGGSSLNEVAQLTDEIDVEAGRVLMRQGELGQEFFLILDGAVVVERDGRVLATLGPGDFLGEIALLDRGPRSATATVQRASRLLVLARPEFLTLISDFPDVRIAVLEALAQRVRRLEPDALS